MFYTKAGVDDPNVEPKLEHSQKVMDAQMRIAVPVNKLKMFAPTNVLASATRATTAIMTTVQQTTEPFARLVAHKAAADELNNFIGVFREEIGRDQYTNEQQQEQVASFMETLKKQVDDFVEESKADMKAAGFRTTPWTLPATDRPGPSRSTPLKNLHSWAPPRWSPCGHSMLARIFRCRLLRRERGRYGFVQPFRASTTSGLG